MSEQQHRDLTPVEQRQRERFINKSTKVAAKYLRRVEELPGSLGAKTLPESLKPFLEVLRKVYVDWEDPNEELGKKTVGTYCVMVPPELIYAAGAVPVKLCSGSYTAFSIGDDLVPRDACPLVKAVMGFVQMKTLPIYDHCSLMVVPVTCDCKKKIAGMLQEVKPTYALHIPSSKSRDEDLEQYLKELYQLIGVLEQATGCQVTYDSLARSIDEMGAAQYEYSRFLEYRRHTPALIKGTHVMAMMNALSYIDAKGCAMLLHKVNLELELRKKKKEYVGKTNQPRILITGSPVVFPNIKLPLLIEEMGGSLVADETCMGDRFLYDPPVVVDPSFDGMMRALANRYTRPCTCPTFTNNSQRIYRIRQMIQDHQVEGVIYHVLRGCLVYDYEYQILEEELGKLDIPIIRVESDYNEEDIEQLRIRIEAFIELIKLKKPVEKAI